jgi:hypothetical protein
MTFYSELRNEIERQEQAGYVSYNDAKDAIMEIVNRYYLPINDKRRK